MKLDVIRVGEATAVVLPEELRARLGLEAGAQVEAEALAKAADQLGARPTPDEVTALALDSAERAMKRYARALAELAK